MNLKDLARILSKEYHLSRSLVNSILKTILKTIVSELKKSNLVRIRNFGTFRARKSHGKLRAKFDDSKNFFK
ncbi:MAG: HU family DNA-binding protein [Elusimicrobia bacterium]|nr:HU family DNA-binding protein [Elusimicrobiota bacterium]